MRPAKRSTPAKRPGPPPNKIVTSLPPVLFTAGNSKGRKLGAPSPTEDRYERPKAILALWDRSQYHYCCAARLRQVQRFDRALIGGEMSARRGPRWSPELPPIRALLRVPMLLLRPLSYHGDEIRGRPAHSGTNRTVYLGLAFIANEHAQQLATRVPSWRRCGSQREWSKSKGQGHYSYLCRFYESSSAASRRRNLYETLDREK